MKSVVLMLAVSLVWGGQVTHAADVPEIIHYQGRIVDGAVLVNGEVSLQIRLYDAATGGTLLCVDSNTVGVIDGLYSTYIGDNLILGSVPDALTHAMVYLETVVNGTVLSPRERLVAVPYAISAQTVRGTNLFVSPSSGYVGVGTTTPQSSLHVEGSLSVGLVHVVSNYTVLSTDYSVVVSSNATLTLPPATTSTVGRIYMIQNAGTGLVFVRPGSGDYLDGLLDTGLQLSPDESVTLTGMDADGWLSAN